MQRRTHVALAALLALTPFVSGCSSTDEVAQAPAAEQTPVWTGALDEAAFAALHDLNTTTPPAPIGREIELADGTRAYLSEAPGGAAPGVIVIHEWWGLNDHIKHWTDRLAATGYNALAVDLYRGSVATTREGAMEAMRAVNDDEARATLRAAALYMNETLRVPKYGSIGWCFGGKWSRLLAQDQPALDACVIFYGQLSTEAEELARIDAPLLGVFGTRDASIPNDVVDAFEAAAMAAGVPRVRVLRYDAEHAFANPSSGRYDAVSAAAAWEEVQSFFAEHLR